MSNSLPNYSAAWVNVEKLDVDFPSTKDEGFSEAWWRERGYKPLKEVSKEQLVAIINQLQDYRDPALEEAFRWTTVPDKQIPLLDSEEIKIHKIYSTGEAEQGHPFKFSPLEEWLEDTSEIHAPRNDD